MLLLPILFSTVHGYAQLAANHWSFYDKKNCSTNCVYEDTVMSFDRISEFPKICPKVCAIIYISDGLSEELLTETFKDMKHLVGTIQIYNLNFTSLKFLAGLETIECDDDEIMISGNSKLVELGLTNLTSISCPGLTVTRSPKLKMLNIPKLKLFLATESSKFCLTTQEVSNWIQSDNTYIAEANGKFCEPIFTEKLCKQPKSGCVEIFGDVKINGDFDLNSMKSVEIIYGSLIINGTNLTDFGFLERLEYVVQLKEKPAISVTENSQLVNYTFPKLKRIHSAISRYMVFQNNKKLTGPFRNGSICYEIRKSLGLGLYALLLDGGSCDRNQIMFLANYNLIELGLTNLTSMTCPGLVVSTSYKMKRLSLPNLKIHINFFSSFPNTCFQNITVRKPFNEPTNMEIGAESPGFCISHQEMLNWLKVEEIDMSSLDGKYCKSNFTDTLCKEPKKGCTGIVGDVKIGENSDPETMKSVEIIYGSLTISGTNWTNFDFLESLEYIAPLKMNPTIIIANNPNLANATFPKLKVITSPNFWENSYAFRKYYGKLNAV
ncbi:unnamed protein product [Caenorhabditis brenneri]